MTVKVDELVEAAAMRLVHSVYYCTHLYSFSNSCFWIKYLLIIEKKTIYFYLFLGQTNSEGVKTKDLYFIYLAILRKAANNVALLQSTAGTSKKQVESSQLAIY